MGVEIKFDKVSVDMLNRIVVDNLLVLDHARDTIVIVQEVVFGLENINFSKRHIRIKKIELNQANIHFFIDSTRSLNLQYIVEKALSASDSTKPGWLVEFDHIGIIDSYLRIEDSQKSVVAGNSINFSDMNLTDFNVRVRDLTVWGGLCTFKINRLSFLEQSGFKLNQLSGRMSIRKDMMHFNNVEITTPATKIKAPRVYFDFKKFGNFSEFDTRVNSQYWIRESQVSMTDIAYFLPVAQGMVQTFSLSGRAKGKFSNLLCSNFKIHTGKSSLFDGNIYVKNLPDINNIYIDMKANSLVLTAEDIEQIYIPAIKEKFISLPQLSKNVGKVHFSGAFKGYANDFVTYGNFKTNIGTFSVDVSLQPQSKNRLRISGKAEANNFDAGKFLNKESLLGTGNLKLNADLLVDNNDKVSGTFNSSINKILFNNYRYEALNINGSLKNNAFDGIVKIEDPNILFSAAGYFDFSRSSTTYNFSSTVYHANPYALNLVKDSINYLSGQLIANMKGRDIDSIDGEIGLANLLLKRGDQSLSVKNIFIKSENSKIIRSINLNSDFIQASIRGEHNLGALKASLIEFVRFYLPKTFEDYAQKFDHDVNKFDFDFLFKNTKEVCSFFSPGSFIAQNSILKGVYNPIGRKFEFELESDSVKFSSFHFYKLLALGNSNNDSVWLKINSNRIVAGDQVSLQKPELNLYAHSDTVILRSFWLDSLRNNSHLTLQTRIGYIGQNSAMIFEILPSEIYLFNDLWTIRQSSFVVDSNSVFVPDFNMFNAKQNISASGSISELPGDVLTAEFSNFNLKIVNFLLKFPKLKLDGKLNGKIALTDFYKTQQIFANVDIDDFTINKEMVGNTSIKIKMDQLTEKLNINANTKTKEDHFININGDYTPEGNRLDFNFYTSKIGVQMFEPFIESIFKIERGTFTGSGELTGTTEKPILNAQVDIDSASMMINALKTSYTFDSKLRIIDNKFLLKNIKLADKDHNICKVDGYIDNEYFKTFQLFITLMLEKNLILDLKPTDEMPFYGKGYASGIVRITGDPDLVNIDIISAKTEKNTIIYIPLNQGNVVANDFIAFTGKENKKDKTGKSRPAYVVKASGLNLNIDLEVSPDAEVQLVFDPALGDIMRAQGNGNLKLELNKSGNFTIRGNYIVRSGDYMFTLKNLLNKQFVIEQGGSIMFNGSPLDATLDVSALYKTRASLYNLFYEEDYKKRIPINCQLFVTGKLLNPDIRYNIALPNAADETRNKVKEAINNEQELSKQFMSLLVLNNFLPDPNKASASGDKQNNASVIGRDAAATTSLELLSSQVSNWVSQISKDFDVGVNYRPGDREFTNQEFEVALSTQLLDDRVSINGNLDFIGNQANIPTRQNRSSLVGDVNVEFKLTEKVILKAFNRSNDQLFDYNDLYTRGIGIAYREEFRDLSDLRHRYYQMLFAPKKNTPADSTIRNNKE